MFAALGSAIVLASLTVGIAAAIPSSFVELDGNVISNGTGTYDWANSGGVTANNPYSRDGTGGLFNGGTFNGNTTPPTAPAETAAALADATIADAEFKVDPLSVDVTACGSGDPTAYTGQGGETNGDILSTDTYGTASVPNKDDLSNVYAVAHVDGTTTPKTNEVFFGAERVINNGDSHIDFEFLQSTVTLSPATCAGSFVGHRTQGDFLLSVDFTTGGTLGGTTLYKWQCDTVFTATHNGNVCDPTKKSQAHYELGGNSAITINVNPGATPIACGGWVCRNPDGSPTATIAQNELMEGGIDLQALGFTGCVSTFLPHTRSSQSFTATLKDFEIIPFNTCKSPTIATQVKLLSNDSNVTAPIQTGVAVYDTATLSGATADAGGTVTYRLYTNDTCTTLSTSPTLGTGTPPAVVVNVTNGIVPASKSAGATGSVSFTNGGTWYFQATYSGDGRNQVPLGGAKSPCTSEAVVIKNNPTVATIIVPAGPVGIPTTAHDTAQISGATANAGGTITYALYSNNDCTGLLADLTPTVNTVTNGIAPDSKTFTFNNAGTFYFYAVYSGDGNNTGPVNSGCAAEPYTVNPHIPTVATIIVPAGPVAIGTVAHDTAQISNKTANAGGTITYALYSNNDCTGLLADLTPTVNTVTNGIAPDSKTFTFTGAGTFYFYAVYSGDANNTGPVNSGCAAEPYTVSPNTPLPHSTPQVQIRDTFSVSGFAAPAATVPIVVKLYSDSACATTALQTTTLAVPAAGGTASGGVTLYISETTGTYYYQMSYAGDTNNNSFTTACTAESVTIGTIVSLP